MAEASGCGAALDLAAVPVAAAANELPRLRNDGVTPLDHALADGEDFELLLAASPDEARRMVRENLLRLPLTIVGEFIDPPGLWRVLESGERVPLAPKGYLH
jgi:thiamine-monophosphate kinase